METKKNILLLLSIVLFFTVSAQNFTGQWKGEFIDKSTSFNGWGGDRCEYVLELECKGATVTGSSYTYFSEAGRKYYTICKLQGFIVKNQKYIEVKETERTKTNVPVNIRNCFQVHKLTYFKHGDSTILEGKWIPAPGQDGDCGIGTTLLSRRELKQSFPKFNNNAAKPPAEKTTSAAKITVPKSAPVKRSPPVQTPAIAKKTVPKNNMVVKQKPVTQNTNTASVPQQRNDVLKKDIPLVAETPRESKEVPEKIIAPPYIKFEKRSNTLLKTIAVENKTVKVDLYDNGEVDGDSISLFYNGRLLLSSKKLSEKPITLNITVEDDDVNELVMYAENLGTIPPNTALMVVTDGAKRYEVRITSDLQKSGVINFVHKGN